MSLEIGFRELVHLTPVVDKFCLVLARVNLATPPKVVHVVAQTTAAFNIDQYL